MVDVDALGASTVQLAHLRLGILLAPGDARIPDKRTHRATPPSRPGEGPRCGRDPGGCVPALVERPGKLMYRALPGHPPAGPLTAGACVLCATRSAAPGRLRCMWTSRTGCALSRCA